jgi:hypothetical protein
MEIKTQTYSPDSNASPQCLNDEVIDSSYYKLVDSIQYTKKPSTSNLSLISLLPKVKTNNYFAKCTE